MISQTSKLARVFWSVSYSFFLLAGIIAFIAPSQILVAALIKVLVYTWAFSLTTGGGLCLGGKLRGNWAGEIIGLPLLSVSHYIFGVLLFAYGQTSAAIAIGGIFWGVGTAFFGRWIELRKLARVNIGVNSGD